MPTTFDNNDVIEVKVACQDDEQVALNISHYRVTSGAGVGITDQDWVDGAEPILAAAYKPLISTNSTFAGVQIQVSRGAIVFPAVFATATAGQGTGPGESLPRQVSGILTKTTPFAGRANRGRIFVPFPPESFNNNEGLPNSSYIGGLEDLGDAYLSIQSITVAGNALNSVWCILRPNPSESPAITGYLARPRWGTQRRRGSYGRPNSLPWVD